MSKRNVMTSPFVVYIDNEGKPNMTTINYVDEFKNFIKKIPDTWDIYDDKSVALAYYKHLIKNSMSPQNEGDITTDIETYKNNKYEIDSQMDDDDELNLTSTNEGADNKEFNDPDLFDHDEERAEREMDENFDDLMENLSKKGGPTINVTESINPRIKKNDLIEYFKNKNNAK